MNTDKYLLKTYFFLRIIIPIIMLAMREPCKQKQYRQYEDVFNCGNYSRGYKLCLQL